MRPSLPPGHNEHNEKVELCSGPRIWDQLTNKKLLEQGARAFESGGGDGAAEHEREIEKLHAKIGQLIIERDFLAKRSGR